MHAYVCNSCYVVVTVSFNQSSYVINESDGLLQPVLVLSEISSFDVKIKVKDAKKSATS